METGAISIENINRYVNHVSDRIRHYNENINFFQSTSDIY